MPYGLILSCLGVALHLERRVRAGFGLVLRRLALPDSFDMEEYITLVAVCSAAAASDCTA